MIVFDDLAGRDGRENDDDDGEDLHDGDTVGSSTWSSVFSPRSGLYLQSGMRHLRAPNCESHNCPEKRRCLTEVREAFKNYLANFVH